MIEFKTVPQLSNILHLIETQGLDIKAFCFDMDGTLFNTEHVHVQASWDAMNDIYPDAAHPHLKSFNHFSEQILGLSDDQVTDLFKLAPNSNKANLFFENRKKYWNIQLGNHTHMMHTEIKALIDEMIVAGYPLALVTSSSRIQCHDLVNKSPLKGLFNYIITRDDVTNPKPSPEPYILAAKKLNLPNENLFVFEDSNVGFTSAQVANSTVALVTWY